MKDFLSIDLESRSTVDLRKSGVYPYAIHPDTDLWCMSYAFGDADTQLWLPGDPVPGEIQYALDEGLDFRAWNAQFERVMLAVLAVPRYSFPRIPLERWVCTAAEAAAMSLPRGLGKAAQVLGAEHQKDDKGHRLMLQMSQPRRPRKDEDPDALLWWDDAGRLAKLCDYCQQDVETERAIAKKLRRLSATEVKVYQLDQRANDRGVLIDVELVNALKLLANEAQARANKALQEITGGAVEAVTNVQNLRRWVNDRGVSMEGLDKQAVSEALATLPPGDVFDALTIRQDAGKIAWKKLDAMLACLCPDNKARGLLLYHGANTGRWSGKLIQPQNFPRPTIKNAEVLIGQVLAGDYDALAQDYKIMDVVTSLLRACLISTTGSRFMCADFSAIEGHVTAWLAGQDSGMVTYEEMAAVIFDVPEEEVTKKQRAVGKVAVLGCGFGMGWKKYKETVKAWTGIDISDKLAKVVVAKYRDKNHRIKTLWYDLQDAAQQAVEWPDTVIYCGRNGNIKYVVRGGFLWCVLPSGRPLAYAAPRIENRMAPWGDMVRSVIVSTVDSYTRKWERRALYGGLQTENVVQAIARDLMAVSMCCVQEEGYNVLLTVHDEVLCEVPNDNGDLKVFNALMSERPNWCQNIPLTVDGWEGQRYRK